MNIPNYTFERFLKVSVPGTCFFQLINIASSKCLEVSGGLLASGANIAQVI
jgi:hypothetical protein